MERLEGIDAALLYMETPTLFTHTLKVALFGPLPPGDAYSFEGARDTIESWLPRLPGFRRRIVPIPLALHHPVWIEDGEFDLDRHVHRVSVPAPGGPREMDAVVSEIASFPLRRDRPLWEMYLLEGLADGRFGGVAKVHHCLADGMAVSHLLAHVLTARPEDLAAPDPWRPEPVPSAGRLVGDALRDHLRQIRRLPRLLARTLHNLGAVLRRRRTARVKPPLPLLETPRTPFNTSLTARRSFETTRLPFAKVRAVRKEFGVTVNDVVLALVAGALRRYLAARGALPDRPLVVEVPVATDAAESPPRLQGNRTSNLFTALPTHLADPVARLMAVHEVTESAKETHRLLGPDLYAAWSQFAPPAIYAGWMQRYSRLHKADRGRPAVNAIVSCVPGPRAPLDWLGAPLEAIYSVGPILEGLGLNLTFWSYLDSFFVGILACPDRVTGLGEISAGLHDELEALSARRPDDGVPRSKNLPS